MRRDWQGFAVCPYKHTMTAAIMTPIDAVLSSHDLKLRNLPVQGVAPHGDKQLGCRVHEPNDTAGNIDAQVRCCQLLYRSSGLSLSHSRNL